MSDSGPAVIVMARAPMPGEGKTRLRPVLSDQECLELQETFVHETVQVALDAAVGPVFLAFTPSHAGAWADRAFGTRTSLFPQSGGDLGDRMFHAIQHVYEQNHAPLLVIGTDVPLLRPNHLRDALKALTRSNLCLGPTEDGGYYLLGCHEPIESLFENVAWGTNTVLETTLERAKNAGLRSELIEELYDVDTPEDLARYRQTDARALAAKAQKTLSGA